MQRLNNLDALVGEHVDPAEMRRVMDSFQSTLKAAVARVGETRAQRLLAFCALVYIGAMDKLDGEWILRAAQVLAEEGQAPMWLGSGAMLHQMAKPR